MQETFYVQSEVVTNSLRTATMGGEEYIVVPVIALVEGVLHSANAENPELALAEEFGRYPNAWDGRPLVMNHPQVEDEYVSANSPTVLEDWSFGQLFNTQLDGNKLKTEAWINTRRVFELGGEVATTVERIQNNEMVEVSTGLFASVEVNEGEYDGDNYTGIWRSVAPDHLAFLSEGTIGACSIADGCGVPRLNMLRRANLKTQSEDCGCGCNGVGTCGESEMTTPTDEQRAQKAKDALDHLSVNAYPSDMPIENARKLLTDALEVNEVVLAEGGLWYIHTYTQDSVVYETFNSSNKYQRSFDITDNTVLLGDDVLEVNLMTSIVPKMNSDASEEVEEEGSEAPAEEPISSSEGEETMSTETQETAEEEVVVETAVEEPVVEEAVVANATPTPVTVEQYIDAAPAEMKEVLANSLKLHNNKRAKLVAEIKSNGANQFDDAALTAMNMATLESVHALASATPNVDYSGQGGGPRANGGNNDNVIPTPVDIFAKPA